MLVGFQARFHFQIPNKGILVLSVKVNKKIYAIYASFVPVSSNLEKNVSFYKFLCLDCCGDFFFPNNIYVLCLSSFCLERWIWQHLWPLKRFKWWENKNCSVTNFIPHLFQCIKLQNFLRIFKTNQAIMEIAIEQLTKIVLFVFSSKSIYKLNIQNEILEY